MVRCETPKRSIYHQHVKIYVQNLCIVQLSVMSRTPILQGQLTYKTTLRALHTVKK